jgi:DNA-binding LytR/AlgR family response regulator
MTLNCLIVDDDSLMREFIAEYVRRTEFLKLTALCANAYEGLHIIEENDEIDILFLDIEMPEVSGLEMLKMLKAPISTILITSQPEYALTSYEYGVIDYLVKPVDYVRFIRAVRKVQEIQDRIERIKENVEYVFAKVNGNFIKIMLKDILFFEALSDYILIHTKDHQYIFLSTMKSLILRLPAEFVRIHRSYIINCRNIDYIEDTCVVIGKKLLPITTTYKDEFFSRLHIL